jgi:hypothetical protein
VREDVASRWGGSTCRARVSHAVPFVLSILVSSLVLGCAERPQEPPSQSTWVPTEPTTPPPQPPTPLPRVIQPIRVTAVTTGVEPDPDGYMIQVDYDADEMMPYHEQDTISTNGSTVLTLPEGYYFFSLSGIAPNCTAVPPRSPAAGSSSYYTSEQLVTLTVECLAIPAGQGVRVTTVTTGTFADSVSFALTIVSDSGSATKEFLQSRSIGANESVTMPSPVGSFHVILNGNLAFLRGGCRLTPATPQPVRVEPNLMTALTFNVSCAQ